jgi:hypothetical protein
MMSCGDVMAMKKRIVNYEEARCVWRLECPFCGWLFGFCLDLTGEAIADEAAFFVGKVRRTPTRFPKRESGRTFAYFKVRSRKCARCMALLIREDDLIDWLAPYDAKDIEYDDLQILLQEMDPRGRIARTCSDRVYDVLFEEWGVNGMPSRYVAIRDSSKSRDKLIALLRSLA